MSRKLAIKGHSTRGKEVIELLEMMGGNTFNSLMENAHPNRVYYIGNNNAITWTNIYSDNGCLETEDFFTLEEFLKKYPFKIGDKVILDNKLCTITWMCWECNKIYYQVQETDSMFIKKVAADKLKPYKETNMDDNKFGTAKEPLKPKSNAVKLVDGKVVDNLVEGKTMNKKLAIKGHSTRGKEVIELLEMMGGINCHNLYGDENYACYIIENGKIKGCEYIFGDEDMYFFTLEEFLEKYPFKVGDKVTLGDKLCEVS